MQCMQEIKNMTYIWLVGIKLPSFAEVQPSSHWCVIWWLCPEPPWCSDDLSNVGWQSRCWEVPGKIAVASLSQSQIGCCKFVPGSWSRRWCAGINNGVVSSFTNRPNWGNHSCFCQHGTITRAVAWSCESLPALFKLYQTGEGYWN